MEVTSVLHGYFVFTCISGQRSFVSGVLNRYETRIGKTFCYLQKYFTVISVVEPDMNRLKIDSRALCSMSGLM